jgi:hypothetical protein
MKQNYFLEEDPYVDADTLALRNKINQLLMQDGIETAPRSRPETKLEPTSATYAVADDDDQVQIEVRNIIKSCLQVEDEAMKMRNKRVKQQDLLYRSPGRTLPAAGKKNTFLTQAPEPAQVVVPVFNKQQNRVVQNVLAHADQDTAEDLAIAMSLLGRYQKDKNFIKKEFLETKRKGELLNIAEEEVKQIKKENLKSTIDLNLTQAERHRNVEDKRKQRIER